MSFQEQASRWMRKCGIPVLTFHAGEAVLERPISSLTVYASEADNTVEVLVYYERVHAPLTSVVNDFRYVGLPAETHTHTAAYRLFRKFPVPKKAT